MKSRCYLLPLLLSLLACQPRPALTDVDGNQYTIQKYGEALWMTENLSVTQDPSGNPVLYFLPNSDSSNVKTYGLLYDYETACKVCPKGWKLPSNQDWEALQTLVDGDAATMKDSEFWKNETNSNASSFSARPAGYGNTEHPNKFGLNTIFWSSTKENEHFIWTYILELGSDSIRKASQHPPYAFSVRCIKE